MTKTRNLADLGGGFIQAGTGAVQRTVESKLQETASVLDFIPPGTNTETTDCATYIQAALDWLTAYTSTEGSFNRGGRALFFPAGNYLTNSTLTIAPKNNVSIYGEGPASMILGGYDLDAPILVVGSAARLTSSFRVADLGFAAQKANATQSTCLVLNRHYGAIIENCTFDRAFNSIVCYEVGHSYIRGCELRKNAHVNVGGVKSGYGLVLDDDGTDYGSGPGTGGCYGIHVDDCEFWGGGDNPANYIKACIWVRDVDGLYINNTHLYNAEHAIWVNPDGVNRNTMTTIQVVNSYLDSCTGPHLLVSGEVKTTGYGNKTFGDFLFSNTYFRHSTNHHVRFDIGSTSDVPMRNVLFADCLFSDCADRSFYNTSPAGKIAGYKVSDCTFDGCATDGGLEVFSDLTMGDVSISGCRFIDSGNKMQAPAFNCIYANYSPGSDISITDNEYLIDTTTEEPVYFGAFPTTIRSFEYSARKSTFGGIATIDRTYDVVVPASDSALLAVIDVNFNFAGVCEYTIIGNDQNGAGLGHHAAHGYFSFRRPAAAPTNFFNPTVAFEHKEGTLAGNTITIGSFDPNVHIRITNALASECKYTAICRVIQRFVET